MTGSVAQHLSQLTPMGKAVALVGAGFSGLAVISLATAGLSNEAATESNWIGIASDVVIGVGGLAMASFGSKSKKSDVYFRRPNDRDTIIIDTIFVLAAGAAAYSAIATARGLAMLSSVAPVMRDPHLMATTIQSFADSALLFSLAPVRIYERLRPSSILTDSARNRNSVVVPFRGLG